MAPQNHQTLHSPVFTSPKEATVKKTDAGTRHARRRLGLIAALTALVVLGVTAVALNHNSIWCTSG